MSNTEKRLVDIYRCKKKEGMYLYINHGEAIEQLPQALQKVFVKAEKAMSLLLHPQRKLANADVHKVMQDLNDVGYYLQLPPKAEVNQQIENAKMPLSNP
ncbi:MAG: YcgL domain-containing protein [Cellvibrionaceae bacterium]|nr:YcgL domain-containing protein [Cellvibrionaceae bacterium]